MLTTLDLSPTFLLTAPLAISTIETLKSDEKIRKKSNQEIIYRYRKYFSSFCYTSKKKKRTELISFRHSSIVLCFSKKNPYKDTERQEEEEEEVKKLLSS